MFLVLGSVFILSTTTLATSFAPPLGPCKYTSYPSLCMSLARPLHRNHPPTAAAVARVSIQATIAKTMQAKGLAYYYLGGNSSDPMGRANLKVCRQLYDDALDSLRQSMFNIKTLRHSRSDSSATIATLKINLSAVITDYTTCDDGFTENPGEKSPLAKVNGMLNKLTSNNLALASKIRY